MTKVQTPTTPIPERRDFPFYNRRPVRLSLASWLIALALTAAGYTALMAQPGLAPGRIGALCAIALFVALPLLGLRIAAGKHWAAPFYRPTLREIGLGLAFAPLTLLVSGTIALGVMRVSLTASNPAAALLLDLQSVDRALFIVATAPQLLGEELITVVPFLALLTLLSSQLRLPRKVAVFGAWLGSAAIFGALHLSTYQWHLGQALLIIGGARLMLTVPYLITKNLWSSVVAHIANDWIAFAALLALSALKHS